MKSVNTDILLLLDSSSLGGIETHVYQLAVGLHRAGKSVHVVLLQHYVEHPLQTNLLNQGVSCTTLDGRKTSLWRFILRHKPRIVHTHGYKAGIIGRLFSKLNRNAVVSTFHAGEQTHGKLALYDFLDRSSACLNDEVISVSETIANRVWAKSTVFDNFISTEELNTSTGKEIAFVGRLSHEKGPDLFVDLAGRFPKHHFHVYGDGPLRNLITDCAVDNIHFHGLQTSMASVWPRIELLVMPSRHEGLPMAALEAMGCGIPVIASNVGALDRLITSGKNGWLIPSENNDILADRLQEWIYMDTSAKRRFKHSARKTIEQQFSARVAIPKLITLYDGIASRQRGEAKKSRKTHQREFT